MHGGKDPGTAFSAPESVAQLRLPELPGRRARDRVEELETLRQLPLRELPRKMLTELVCRRRLTRTKHDTPKRSLTPLRIGHCNHRGFRNRGVTHQLVL